MCSALYCIPGSGAGCFTAYLKTEGASFGALAPCVQTAGPKEANHRILRLALPGSSRPMEISLFNECLQMYVLVTSAVLVHCGNEFKIKCTLCTQCCVLFDSVYVYVNLLTTTKGQARFS